MRTIVYIKDNLKNQYKNCTRMFLHAPTPREEYTSDHLSQKVISPPLETKSRVSIFANTINIAAGQNSVGNQADDKRRIILAI